MEYSDFQTVILMEIPKIKDGQVFLAKDLFVGYDWAALSKNEKLSFGRYLKKQVLSKAVSGIAVVGNAGNGSAQYIKNGGNKQ